MNIAARTIVAIGICATTWLSTIPSAVAHDPKPILRSIYGAPLAIVTTYEVKGGAETEFIDAMVQTGPYNRVLYAFANERLIQEATNAATNTTTFISFARYYDASTADFIDAKRNPAVARYVVRTPVREEAKLIEHELADWGWEKGTDQAVLQVKPLGSEEIFQKNISALSFFKSGYVGQTGIWETLPAGTSTESIRHALQGRMGLSGASILTTQNGVAVYSEYFKTPKVAATDELASLSGNEASRQVGMVVQNYVSR